jgi:ribosomal protein L37AE/L43A
MLYLVFRLVLWLIIDVPVVGIPVLLAVVAWLIWAARRRGAEAVEVEGTPVQTRRHRDQLAEGIAALRRHDPAFSRHLVLDFSSLLFARVHEARGSAPIEPVLPYLAPATLKALDRSPDVVERVIVGAVTLESVSLRGADRAELRLSYEANVRERRGGSVDDLYVRERWVLDRRRDVRSKPPEQVERLGCPSCGASGDLDVHGRCTFCKNPVNRGDFDWVVQRIQVLERRPRTRVEVSLGGGGDEPGVRLPTVMQSDFAAARRAFESRNPDFTWQRFTGRARTIFTELQQAWSTLAWERARPFETDHLFQTHRYWIERYREDGLRNALDDIIIERVEPCRIELDPFYETITVRIFASMRDYVVDSQGSVVGGNARTPRRFSEYWTFIRRAGRAEVTDKAPDQCPSCGAPLKVDAAAICTFCGSKVASGDFDWVASLIEQDEVYRG